MKGRGRLFKGRLRTIRGYYEIYVGLPWAPEPPVRVRLLWGCFVLLGSVGAFRLWGPGVSFCGSSLRLDFIIAVPIVGVCIYKYIHIYIYIHICIYVER